MSTMSDGKLEELLDSFAHEAAVGCEYDNRERIADARKAVIDHVHIPAKIVRKDAPPCVCADSKCDGRHNTGHYAGRR